MKEKIKRIRADELLSLNPSVGSRSKAKALIIAGEVSYLEQRLLKPSQMIPENAELVIKQPAKYVGRGGFKLEKALADFDLKPDGLVAMDVGASTGGFTDCLLQNGALMVYCIDVGYGQLASKIVSDKRIVQMDRTNARNLKPSDFDRSPQCAVVDCSFISGDKVIAPLREILSPPAWIVWLLKPQFEAGPGRVGKGGVIRKIEILKTAIEDALSRVIKIGAKLRGAIHSPITGSDGNNEFLVHLDFGENKSINPPDMIQRMLQGLNLKQ